MWQEVLDENACGVKRECANAVEPETTTRIHLRQRSGGKGAKAGKDGWFMFPVSDPSHPPRKEQQQWKEHESVGWCHSSGGGGTVHLVERGA